MICDGHCQEHDRKARQIITMKSVWTKNVKTGVFGYRRQKISVLRCDKHMGTLVGTIESRDGADGSNGTFEGTAC